MISIITLFILSCLSAICYRAGGLSQEDPCWIPKWLRKRWVRDWICPAFNVGLFLPLGNFWSLDMVWWLCAYGATGGMLTTYWDWMFGYDNLWFAGFMVGMASLFLALMGYAWWLFVIRALLLAVIWGGLNYWINKHAIPHSADIEEYTRGFTLC